MSRVSQVLQLCPSYRERPLCTHNSLLTRLHGSFRSHDWFHDRIKLKIQELCYKSMWGRGLELNCWKRRVVIKPFPIHASNERSLFLPVFHFHFWRRIPMLTLTWTCVTYVLQRWHRTESGDLFAVSEHWGGVQRLCITTNRAGSSDLTVRHHIRFLFTGHWAGLSQGTINFIFYSWATGQPVECSCPWRSN